MEYHTKPKASAPSGTLSLYHYLYEVDWSVSRLLARAIQAFLFLVVLSLALFGLSMDFYDITEYQEGFSDISTVEAIFAVCFLLLCKRYFAYSNKTSLSWWKKITTPLIWYGKFALIAWLIMSTAAFVDLSQGTDHLNAALLRGEHYLQLLSFSSILLSLYISVPSKKTRLTAIQTEKEDGGNAAPEDASTSEPNPTRKDA